LRAFHACLLEQKPRDNPGGHAYAGHEQDDPAGSASARLQALLNDPATRAAATVARDPGYAAVAAALYQSAALFRFQTGDPGDALPTGNVPIPGVTGIQGIPPLNAV
jgi:hypothetical protein